MFQSNQHVDVYEWRAGNDLTCISSLRGHTRVVSDTHFHRQDHNLIATCSIDTFTYLWDLRDTRKPVCSLSAVGKTFLLFSILLIFKLNTIDLHNIFVIIIIHLINKF